MKNYKYDGLADNVWLTNGVEFVDTPFGKGQRIERLDQLGTVVLNAVIRQPARLVGGNIAFLRTKAGLTQSEFAELIGVNVQSVSLWERNSHSIPAASDIVLRALAIDSLTRIEKKALGALGTKELAQLAVLECPLDICMTFVDGCWSVAYQRQPQQFEITIAKSEDVSAVEIEMSGQVTSQEHSQRWIAQKRSIHVKKEKAIIHWQNESVSQYLTHLISENVQPVVVAPIKVSRHVH